MAVDQFIKFEGPAIKGESLDKTHKEEIDVLTWSWGVTNDGNTHMGGGGGAGKVSVGNLNFSKPVDKSTTDLILSACDGTHHETVTLVVRKAGTNPIEYLKITMNEVLISSYNTSGQKTSDQLTENLSLNFAKVKVEYTPQKTDGKAEATKTTVWDIAANVKG